MEGLSTEVPRDMSEQTPAFKLPIIPFARYTDEAFYKDEITSVFKKSWLSIGHVSEFKEAGSYRLLNMPFAPAFVIRGKDGALRAFLNVCRHRGAALLKDPSGCAKGLTCQYHAWTYDLSGKLIGLPQSDSFPELDKTSNSLISIRCEQWGGLVFVNFDRDAAPLLDCLPPSQVNQFTDVLAEDKHRPLRIAARKSWSVPANWKLIVENFWEFYHLPFIHSETANQALASERADYSVHPNGHGTTKVPYRDARSNVELVTAVATDASLSLLPGMSEALAADLKRMVHNLTLFPNSLLSVGPSNLIVTQIWPISRNESRLDVIAYAEDWGAGDMPEAILALANSLEPIVLEDLTCLADVQRSVEGHPTGHANFGWPERLLCSLHANIDKMIGVQAVPAALRVPDVLSSYTTQ